MLGNLTYTVPRSDNVRVPLISGGAQKPVGPAGLPQYCDMIEHFRRHEFDMQCAAMLKGLCQLIPPRSLPLFSWEELENLVCGSKTVDVMLLQKHTTCAPRCLTV
jgi:HECT-domain (ubiquitin-transferase)